MFFHLEKVPLPLQFWCPPTIPTSQQSAPTESCRLWRMGFPRAVVVRLPSAIFSKLDWKAGRFKPFRGLVENTSIFFLKKYQQIQQTLSVVWWFFGCFSWMWFWFLVFVFLFLLGNMMPREIASNAQQWVGIVEAFSSRHIWFQIIAKLHLETAHQKELLHSLHSFHSFHPSPFGKFLFDRLASGRKIPLLWVWLIWFQNPGEPKEALWESSKG